MFNFLRIIYDFLNLFVSSSYLLILTKHKEIIFKLNKYSRYVIIFDLLILAMILALSIYLHEVYFINLVKYHAIELLKVMGKCYNNLIPEYINPTITNLMTEYTTNCAKNHSRKIIAINLIFACLIKNFSSLSLPF